MSDGEKGGHILDGLSFSEKKKLLQKTIREQAIRNEVGTLNKWDEDSGETLERQRARYAETLIRDWEQKDSRFREAVAAYGGENIQLFGVAAGEPVQEFEPAKKAKCQSCQDRHRISLAKRSVIQHTPEGGQNSLIQERLDGNSYQIQTGIAKAIAELDGNMEAHKEQKERPDYAVMRAFSGMSDALADDYQTDQYEKRKKYLRWMTDSLLEQEISMEHFTPECLAQAGRQIYTQILRFKAYRTAYEDPINRLFFENLSEAEKQLIQVRILDMADLYENALRLQCRSCGVDMDNGQYLTEDAQLAALSKEIEAAKQLRERLLLRNEKTRLAVMNGYAAGMEEAERRTRIQQEEKERLIREEQQQLQGTGLTGFLVGYAPQEIQDLRELFSENIDSYEANKPLLDLMEQEFFHVMDAKTDYMRRTVKQDSLRLELDPLAGSGTLLEKTLGSLTAAEAERLNLLQIPLERRLSLLKAAMQTVIKNKEPKDAGVAGVIKEFQRKIAAKQPGLDARIDEMTAGWKEASLQPPEDPEALAHTYYTGEEDLGEYATHLTGTDSAKYVAQLRNLGIKAFFDAEEEAGRMRDGAVQMTGGIVRGLYIGRMVTNVNIMTVLGGITVEQGKEMLQKLSQGKMGEQGTAQKDAAALEGVLMYKNALYTYLKGLEQKYGRLLTQLHPEDVLRRINIHELAMVMKPMQDMVQLIDNNETGVAFFDEANEADQEYKRLASYFFRAFRLLSFYARIHIGLEPEAQEDARTDLTGTLDDARQFEELIGGPALKASQMPYYAQSVRERYGEDVNFLRSMSYDRW